MVKLMHILNGRILQMVTDKGNVAIANKYEVAYGLSVGIFIFDVGPF